MSNARNRLSELVDELADTPTLSAYLCTDAARRGGGTHGVWVVEVGRFVQDLRHRYADAVTRGDRDAFERNLRRLELRLRGLPNAARAPGWLVVVARGDIHYCAPVPFAGPSDGRWQHGVTLLVSPTTFSSSAHIPPYPPGMLDTTRPAPEHSSSIKRF